MTPTRKLAAEPAHIARIAANILRLCADECEQAGYRLITPDDLRAQAAALDKASKT